MKKHLLAWVVIAACCGCTQKYPSAVQLPAYSGDAGQGAVSQYDTNSDGLLSADELKKAPGVKVALGRIDTNGDKQLSQEEIDARVQNWVDTKTGIMSVRLYFKLDGRPLPDATVTLVPESFLGTEVKPATATTNESGQAIPYVSEKMDEQGVQPGFYRIEVSRKDASGKELLPARYNSESELGMEAGPGAAEVFGVTYELSSR